MDPVLATLRGVHTAPGPTAWPQRPWVVYPFDFSSNGWVTSGNAHELADYGFTTTSLTLANGSAADLPDAGWETLDVGVPGLAKGDGANDLFQTPSLFADPEHFYWAGRLMGSSRPPRMFVAEWYGALPTGSADESTSGFGLVEDGGAAGTAADRFAWIRSDSTNMLLGSGAGTGTVVNALALTLTPLFHRIEVDRVDQLIRWFTSTDGITWTARATLALEADELPVSFGAFAGTTNRFELYSGMLYYI